MLEKFFSRKVDYEIIPMEVAHCRAASAIHGERFLRGWSDGEFHDLLGQDTVGGFVAFHSGLSPRDGVTGFVLSRTAAGEAEILSIGVTPRVARQGLGWRLMRAALADIVARDATTVFLEVDETNTAARALYAKLGFAKVAERPAYYAGPDGKKTAAHVMRLDLTAPRKPRSGKP
ncbi:GNAT family N-acetyltransferase [Rhizobium sp. C1]|uniref:GNAT family N-acetyltransferase n=1 Tax=Rhizobium sp. C1 TaxID=1349799 RepID=UPI001E435FA7|nr:N-acetyltransferase [Rhizobium sp. C1]MCD2180239.1 GNAT family N-acetyltransferase [Rhizobium sp. C1]